MQTWAKTVTLQQTGAGYNAEEGESPLHPFVYKEIEMQKNVEPSAGPAGARDWQPVLRGDDYLPRACTGYLDRGSLQHDGDTCPIHEA